MCNNEAGPGQAQAGVSSALKNGADLNVVVWDSRHCADGRHDVGHPVPVRCQANGGEVFNQKRKKNLVRPGPDFIKWRNRGKRFESLLWSSQIIIIMELVQEEGQVGCP